MSKTRVKKALAGLDAEALREMIMEMYAARREARDYLEFWANPDLEQELDAAKSRIFKVYFTAIDKPRRKPTVTEVKTIKKNFETLCPDPERMCDMMLYIPETMLSWLKARRGLGMVSCRPRIEKAIEEASAYIESSGMEAQFGLRLDRLRESFRDFYDNQPATTLRGRRRRWGWY